MLNIFKVKKSKLSYVTQEYKSALPNRRLESAQAIGIIDPLSSNEKLQTVSQTSQNPFFSIITAVYNSEQYLDDFFSSLFRQSFPMDKTEIIVVDDCSSDCSYTKLLSWQKHFPIIRVLKTSFNSGQAAARNVGIEAAKGRYLTFIDSDDFIEKNYLSRIAAELKTRPTIKVLVTHPIFYQEASDEYQDTHALKNQFRSSSIAFSLPLDADAPIIMSSCYAVISRDSLGNLRFDDNIKPTFEDAHFMCKYQLNLGQRGLIAHAPRAFYLYRKRKNLSSTLDRSKTDIRQYTDVLRYGCIDLIDYSKNTLGFVPRMVQRRVLYQVLWIYKTFYNNDDLAAHVMGGKIQEVRDYLATIAESIDEQVISSFEIPRFGFELLFGYLNYYNKSTNGYIKRSYITNIDTINHTICINEYYKSNYYINGKKVKPTSHVKKKATFLCQEFFSYYETTVQYGSDADILSIRDENNNSIEIKCPRMIAFNPSIAHLSRKLKSNSSAVSN